MKLIIDVDDEVFKRLKAGCPEPDDCFKCQDSVFYGKPYEETPQGECEDYSVNFYKCPKCGYLLNKDCPNCQNKIVLPNSERPHEKQRW